MSDTERVAERIQRVLDRLDGGHLSLQCVRVEAVGGRFVATLRAIWSDVEGDVRTIRHIVEQAVPFASDAALAEPERLDAYLEGWSAALPALIARAGPDLVPADLVFAHVYDIEELTTAEGFAAAFASATPEQLDPATVSALSATAPVARNPELEAAIDQDPEAIGPYLVYADWLQERGDPRGDLIVGLAPGATPRARLRAQRVKASRHAYFLGNLVEGDPCLRLTWGPGYLVSADIGLTHEAYERGTRLGEDLVRAVLSLPSSRFLRELTVGMFDFEGENHYDRLYPAFEEAGPRPSLRSLFLGDFEYPDECEISWVRIGEVSRVLRLCPNLRSLRLRGAGIDLGDLPCPELRELVLETGALPRQPVDALRSAALPHLERLELWFGDESYGAECEPDDLDGLLADLRAPALRHLGLMNCAHTDHACAALADWPQAGQLETLDLSLGTLTDAGAALLVAAAPRFGRLTQLDVRMNHLGPEAVAALERALPGVRADRQGRQDDVYVSVGE